MTEPLSPSKLRVGIVGATGYTGLELCRFLLTHPYVEVTALYAQQNAGQRVSDVYPHLFDLSHLTYLSFDSDEAPDLDVLFLALPHGASQHFMGRFLNGSCKILDLSADFRLKNPVDFEKYYSESHSAPELLDQVPLVFPELYEGDFLALQAAALPGCYSTSVILGLTPLARQSAIEGTVIVDAKSGVSGAGKALKTASMFCEVHEAFMPYSTGQHRHEAEMRQELGVDVIFSPHLLPMSRGILSSMYVRLPKSISFQDVQRYYQDAYGNCAWIRLLSSTQAISTKWVKGTNFCAIQLKYLPESHSVVVFSAIDNLIKGASGQAVQVMNKMFGYSEILGLPRCSFYL